VPTRQEARSHARLDHCGAHVVLDQSYTLSGGCSWNGEKSLQNHAFLRSAAPMRQYCLRNTAFYL
jgi:hypothetical protein